MQDREVLSILLYSHSPREPSPPVSRVYSATIRKVDRLFIAGKMEPILRVCQPYDNAFNETTTSLENYLLQQYFKKSTNSIPVPCSEWTIEPWAVM